MISCGESTLAALRFPLSGGKEHQPVLLISDMKCCRVWAVTKQRGFEENLLRMIWKNGNRMDVGDIDAYNKNNNSHTIANKKDIAGQSGDQHNDFAVFAAMQHWRGQTCMSHWHLTRPPFCCQISEVIVKKQVSFVENMQHGPAGVIALTVRDDNFGQSDGGSRQGQIWWLHQNHMMTEKKRRKTITMTWRITITIVVTLKRPYKWQ